MENDKLRKGVETFAERFAKEQLVGVLSLQYHNQSNTPEQKEQIYNRLKELLIGLYGITVLEQV